MKRNAQRGSLLITIALAVASVAYLFFLLLPGWKSVGQVRAQVRLKRDYVLQSSSTLAAMAATQREIDSTLDFNRRLARELPSVVEAPSVFSQITEIAKSSHATTSRFDPEPVIRHAKLSQMGVAMALAGQTGQLYEFVRGVEGLPIRIWVESLRITAPSKDSQIGTAEVGAVIFVDNSENSDYMKRVE